jgi:uncharacterized zinc-type alcohol dehydrogenase-like protein
MLSCTGYAASSKHASLTPFSLERREPEAGEIQFEVLYCGVCLRFVIDMKSLREAA